MQGDPRVNGEGRTLALGRILVRRQSLLDALGHPARGPVRCDEGAGSASRLG
jgi:hypothetical protein